MQGDFLHAHQAVGRRPDCYGGAFNAEAAESKHHDFTSLQTHGEGGWGRTTLKHCECLSPSPLDFFRIFCIVIHHFEFPARSSQEEEHS